MDFPSSNLEITQILTEGEAFDDAANSGVYFMGCAKKSIVVFLGVHQKIGVWYSRFGGTCKNIHLPLTPFAAAILYAI